MVCNVYTYERVLFPVITQVKDKEKNMGTGAPPIPSESQTKDRWSWFLGVNKFSVKGALSSTKGLKRLSSPIGAEKLLYSQKL